MRGLPAIPSLGELEQAYSALQSLHHKVELNQLILWTQWARLDPRLAEILVGYLSRAWSTIDPLEMNAELQKVPWPAALGVHLEQIHTYLFHDESLRQDFDRWRKVVMAKIEPAPGELFFIGHRALGGKLALHDAERSHPSFSRWGYFGRELLLNKAQLKIK